MTPCLRVVPFLCLCVVVATGCASGGRRRAAGLPTTPRLEHLTAADVLAGAPPAEWHEPMPEDPARASVEFACGVSPRLSNGTVYAAVSVQGRPPQAAIAPLNVSLVLDRSGSMRGAPFDNMLRAAEAFVARFRDGDRVSVVVFSSGIYEAVAPVVIDPATRGAVVQAIRGLAHGGATHLSGGLLAGLSEIWSSFAEWQVHHLVLLSDGQPTHGITEPQRLAELAWRAAEHGVSITSIGFGPAHDELLMQTIADAGGGTYHYVESPADIPGIFEREAADMLDVAARGTVADVAVPAGYVVEDVLGHDYFAGAGRIRIRLGTIPHGQERYVVLRLRPRAAGASGLPVSISYSDMSRRRKVALRCRPRVWGEAGGGDRWVLELAGRAEAYWGLAEAMGWADNGSEVFVISQIGHTRGLIAAMREVLGPGALTQEDRMLEAAQVRLGLNVASGAASAASKRGLSGLVDFGARAVLTNTATAAVAKADAGFRPLLRAAVQTSWYGQPAQLYSARTQRPFKMHTGDRNRTYKQARFDAYVHMRTRAKAKR